MLFVVVVSLLYGGSGESCSQNPNLPGVQRLTKLLHCGTGFVEDFAGLKKVTFSFAEWNRGLRCLGRQGSKTGFLGTLN